MTDGKSTFCSQMSPTQGTDMTIHTTVPSYKHLNIYSYIFKVFSFEIKFLALLE